MPHGLPATAPRGPPASQIRCAVDTGFIVYNQATYPNLIALFEHLRVATQPSDMSFAVSLDGGGLEYSGGNLAGLFAQKRNLVSPRFWSMLSDLQRFYREAPRHVAALDALHTTLGDYLEAGRYGGAFRDDHLLPMAGAIWSAPARALLDYPAASFIRFHDNHGLLRIRNRPPWRTVTGGSRNYVRALAAGFADRIRLNSRIAGLRRTAAGVELRHADGAVEHGSTMWCWRRMPTRRWRCWTMPARRSARRSAPSATAAILRCCIPTRR